MFWDDGNDPSQLVANARGDSVTEKRLTKTGARVFGAGYPEERPIIECFEDGEQPHHIFYNKTKGVTLYINGAQRQVNAQLSHSTFAVLTDKRIFIIIPTKEQDVECGVYYESAHAARFQTGSYEHQMDIATGEDGLTFFINTSIKASEIEAARDFITPRLNPESTGESIVDAQNFGVANDALGFDFDIDVGIEEPERTMIGSEAPTSGTQTVEHRSEHRSEIAEPDLVRMLRDLDAYSFEELIADLWIQRGWTAKATAESGDRGIDVVAERRDPIPEKQLIQAKKYKEGNTVGSSDIQQYSSLRHQQPGVDVVVVVTTSTFTKQAKEIAEDLNVKLVDIDLLCEIIRLADAYDIVRWHAGERGPEGNTDEDPASEGASDGSEQSESDRESEPDPIEEIRRIRELEEEGIISEDEFNAKKQELLDRI